MSWPRNLRLLIALGVLVLALAALALLLVLGEAALNIQARLSEAPAWQRWAWWGLIGLGSLAVGAVLWRLLLPRRRPADAAAAPAPPDEGQLLQRLDAAEALGVHTAAVRAELEQLRARRAAGEVHVALFGEISTGKSALVRALLPDAETVSDVRGGTTRALQRYRWTSPAGDALVLTDMPGTAEAQGALDDVARAEALRAHIVLYVCDSDLNRGQRAELDGLLALGKPVVVALNKSDRYSAAELQQLRQRLSEQLAAHPGARVVSVSAGARHSVLRVLPDGSEETLERESPPQVDELAAALQRIIDGDLDMLEQLRDSAVFVLAAQQLDAAQALARRERASQLVDGYAKKAVVGALAAITPGADLLIQGWLGTQLVKELGALYGVKVRKLDIDLLLELVQRHVGRTTTLLLAVAGNAFKAFPGIGTLTGGALHAVAYGLIFRTLGKALVTTLETRGELHPVQTATLFKETLGDNLEASAGSLARLALEQARRRDHAD
ncbi:MAG: hypothetical protein RLZ44_1326 [Pseudomonadota bacterium]|jgi:GTP-binding protein EngB required for normal cell division